MSCVLILEQQIKPVQHKRRHFVPEEISGVCFGPDIQLPAELRFRDTQIFPGGLQGLSAWLLKVCYQHIFHSMFLLSHRIRFPGKSVAVVVFLAVLSNVRGLTASGMLRSTAATADGLTLACWWGPFEHGRTLATARILPVFSPPEPAAVAGRRGPLGRMCFTPAGPRRKDRPLTGATSHYQHHLYPASALAADGSHTANRRKDPGGFYAAAPPDLAVVSTEDPPSEAHDSETRPGV